jgi:hypothetical protein
MGRVCPSTRDVIGGQSLLTKEHLAPAGLLTTKSIWSHRDGGAIQHIHPSIYLASHPENRRPINNIYFERCVAVDLQKCAEETFQVLLRFDYTVKLFDKDGMDVAEPSEARRMFASRPNLMVSLSDADDDSSITLWFGKSTHANDIDGLMQALRTSATKYNMTFKPNQYGKEIDPKDYQNMISIAESKKGIEMHVCEGMYGTSRSSYLCLDNAKMIIHHSARIHPTRAGARAQHIGSIFIENAAGVRVPSPSMELDTARAMTEHVNAGGECSEAALESALHAYRASREPAPPKDGKPYLAENNPVIREFMLWTEQFAPDRALLEWNDNDGDNGYDDDGDDGRNDDGDDGNNDDGDDGRNDDGDDGKSQLEAIGKESTKLTREDMLLPHPNQGDGFAQGVTKATVNDDPRNPDEEHPPGAGYVARLKSQGFHRMHEDNDEPPADTSHAHNLARLKQLAGIWMKKHLPKEQPLSVQHSGAGWDDRGHETADYEPPGDR